MQNSEQIHRSQQSSFRQGCSLKLCFREARLSASFLLAAALQALLAPIGLAQAITPELSPAATVETAAKVVRWTGTLSEFAGKTVEIQFGIYENAAGGLALWSESQHVTVGADGRYSVLLGATSNEGLPQTLFPAGVGRWVAAHPISSANSEAESTRSLLAAVPYAFKAVDAETLAGRSAADYVTREDLKAATSTFALPALTAPVATQAIQPNLAGTGSPNYLPIWTNSTTLGNSTVYETASKVGIGITAPSTTLDVNGTTTLRGTTYLPAINTSTTSTGYGSRILQFGASSWSSSSGVNVPQTFQLEALPVANNTAAPSANLSLLYGAGANTPKATGLSFAANGLVTFAAGQKFPGIITGITATSPLTGGGTSGALTIGLNTATLETTLNGKYPQLAAANNFTTTNTFAGEIIGNSTGTTYSILGNTASGVGVGGISTGTGGQGLHGYASGNGAIGMYANAVGGPNGSTYPTAVLAHVVSGIGVKSTVDTGKVNQEAILGQVNGASGTFTAVQADGTVGAGVWGDIKSGSIPYTIGVLGTTDNGWAAYFANNSASFPTLELFNYNSSGSIGPNFSTFKAGSPQGVCGISGQGNLSCTGQVKTLVSTRGGERTLETYSVQSPESWMEDFGDAQLHNGAAIVTIDPDFAETASESAKYHVFLTPRGDSKGLYVTNLTAKGFEVREAGGGTSSIAFDYRIVAKRRGLEAQRLTDITESIKAEMKPATKRVNGGERVNQNR